MKKRLLGILFSAMICFLTFGFAGCDQIISEHFIFVSSSDSNNGTTELVNGTTVGYGTFWTNTSVTIKAIPNDNCTFLAWSKNNEIVSYDQDYNFVASSSTEGKYIALFSTTTFEYGILKSAVYEYKNVSLIDTNTSLSKITTWDLKYKQTGINDSYTNLASFSDVEVSDTGGFSYEEMNLLPKVLYSKNSYIFELNLDIGYTGAVDIPILTTFEIDFNKITSNSKVVVGNTTTYTDINNNYKLILKNTNSSYEFTVEYYNFNTSTKWKDTDNTTQKLILNFNYPFSEPEIV